MYWMTTLKLKSEESLARQLCETSGSWFVFHRRRRRLFFYAPHPPPQHHCHSMSLPPRATATSEDEDPKNPTEAEVNGTNLKQERFAGVMSRIE